MSLEELEPLGRLLDDPALASELRADLLVARSYEVPFDATAGLARFQAHLDTLPENVPGQESGTTHGPVTPDPVTTSALQLTGGKILAVLALAAGLGWGALELTGGSERKASLADQSAEKQGTVGPVAQSGNARKNDAVSEPVVAPHSFAASHTIAGPVKGAEPAKLAAPALSTLGPQATPAPQKLELPKTAPAPEPVGGGTPAPAVNDAPAPSAADRLAREVAHLGELRRTLAADPARALALADQGHAQFADGALRQEREALALSALEKLGRRDALNQRGSAFLTRYPQSSFASQIKRMLDQ